MTYDARHDVTVSTEGLPLFAPRPQALEVAPAPTLADFMQPGESTLAAIARLTDRDGNAWREFEALNAQDYGDLIARANECPTPKRDGSRAVRPALGKDTDFVDGDAPSIRRHREWLRNASARILGHKRVASCGQVTAYRNAGKLEIGGINRRLPTSRAEGVTVRVREGKPGPDGRPTARASYGNIARCACSNVCPVCAPVINERRRAEVVHALAAARGRGYGVLMQTWTVPHEIDDKLRDLLDRLNAARRWMMQTGDSVVTEKREIAGKVTATSGDGRKILGWRLIKKAFGLVGEIRSLEVTRGRNGWHPHYHILWITKQPLDERQLGLLQDAVLALWQYACVLQGFAEPSEERGIEISLGHDEIGEYVTKWGLAEELTQANRKTKGKRGSRNPWAILLSAAKGNETDEGLWWEWYEATRRKAALTWSKGLRVKLGMVAEQTDEEVLDEVETDEAENGKAVARLSAESVEGALGDWQILIRARRQLDLLDMVERLHLGGADVETIQAQCEAFIGRLRRLMFPAAFTDEVRATFQRKEDPCPSFQSIVS